jgi:hypothetical protein|uniref:Uncharacterized protein n=1 Tax=Siphoviridae sp. ctvxh7 TaxID=2827283 RepID=A0A8S5R999_9CAUD|nr:MAG TPA: hypothetical protein [Siphoviridae sp. ctvxh7]
MDVAEFFSELRRMCKSSSDCAKCEYHGDRCDNAIELFEKTVAMVEQWSREHPRKTRQSVFLEQWPEAKLFVGAIDIKPCSLVASLRSECPKTSCYDCRRKFWMQEVE